MYSCGSRIHCLGGGKQWRRQDFRKGGALVLLNVRAQSARKIFGDHAH